MTTQMIVRMDPKLKDRLDTLARREGKTTSEIVRELIEEYIKEKDIGPYIDDLWDRIGRKLKSKGTKLSDIDRAVKGARKQKV